MTDLDFKSAHQLNAVMGWLELGNVKEAREELDRIGPDVQERPDLLEVRWILDARQEDWPAALKTAERLQRAFCFESEFRVREDLRSTFLHATFNLFQIVA